MFSKTIVCDDYNGPSIYKVYLSDDITKKGNEKYIGEANTFKQICKLYDKYLKENNIPSEYYTRILDGNEFTAIDFGSWSYFIHIYPAVPVSELYVS